MDTQIVKASAELERPMRVEDVLEQVALIQRIMQSVMKQGEHYGVIPGTGQKPSLLKPGAEKICFTFRLAPEYEVIEREMEQGHREYRVNCTLRTVTGRSVGQGVGSCSTMESKYRFRSGPKEATGKAVPHEYWQMRKSDPQKALELIGGKGHVVAKESGMWQIFTQGEKAENDSIADTYNTVLKMAKKRAHVDAVLTATAASDIFTQDIEEIIENRAAVAGDHAEEQEGMGFQQAARDALFGAKKPSGPADWREVGVAAQGPSEGMALGELDEEKLEFLFSNWIPARLGKAASKEITPAERAMIDGVMDWKRQQMKAKPNPMTSEQYQELERERQASVATDEVPF
jgi:hypothetical protein